MKPVSFPQTAQTRLISIKEAAGMLGVSLVTVRRRVRDGSLPHIRIKSQLYFKLSDLHAYVESHRGNLVF